jgi:hypothetical protein
MSGVPATTARYRNTLLGKRIEVASPSARADWIVLGRNHRASRAVVMALVRRFSRPPGMPDAFDRAPLR